MNGMTHVLDPVGVALNVWLKCDKLIENVEQGEIVYVNWGLIVKVSKARHDCGGGTISSIQKSRTISPITSHTRSMQQSICSPAADLVSCLSLSDKRQTKTELQNVCVHEGFFYNSTEENPVTVATSYIRPLYGLGCESLGCEQGPYHGLEYMDGKLQPWITYYLIFF